MCRECHDLAPNTAVPEIFFEWVGAQSHWKREFAKLDEALRSFGVSPEQYHELTQVLNAPDFKVWVRGKIGLHRPQSNYASTSSRLTHATLVGLIVHYLKSKPLLGNARLR
jgi:hypothetical protein